MSTKVKVVLVKSMIVVLFVCVLLCKDCLSMCVAVC